VAVDVEVMAMELAGMLDPDLRCTLMAMVVALLVGAI